MRVAIASAGPMTRQHAGVINARDGATIVAIADPDLAPQSQLRVRVSAPARQTA